MRADEAGDGSRPAGPGPGRDASVRQRLRSVPAPAWALLGIVALALVLHGFRVLGNAWIGGDLLYHSALASAILRGEFPPGGPYEGLPAYYPPGFHLLLAATMAVTGAGAGPADQLLHFLWAPVLPLATFWLTRWITGRDWVAVTAAALTLFAGGYDFQASRLWVNSLFLSGHDFYPLYPRDVVFALLPLGVLAFLRATASPALGGRWLAWALAAGVVLGICGLVQVQLLLPLPAALATFGVVVAWRRRGRRAVAVATLAVCGLVGAAIVVPWLLPTLEWIRRNGGVALDSAEMLEPARFGPWSYPREFGLLLPLAVLGAGVALLLLRRADGPRPDAPSPGRWRPAIPEGPLVLVAWFTVPFLLAVLYRPDWPLEDALRPQRLWLLAGQPAAILAAIGLVAGAEQLARGSWRRPKLVAPMVVLVALVASIPATAFTAALLASTWARPTYAHLDLESDRTPAFAELLGRDGPRSTVLTYEDWSSLVWYETGLWVVGTYPPGYAKLAYDPGVFTGRSQAERRADLVAAFAADAAGLAAVADAYGAGRIVLARRGERWGLLDVPAGALLAAAPEAIAGPIEHEEGNGYDALRLMPGSRVRLLARAPAGEALELVVRARPADAAGLVPPRFRLLAGATAGGAPPERALADLEVPAGEEWGRAIALVTLHEGEALWLEALDAVILQSARGFVAPTAPPDGWRVAASSPDAVVLATGTAAP